MRRGGVGLGLGIGVVVAVAGRMDRRSRDAGMGLRIQALCGWRRRRRVVFQGRDVGWFGILCLRLGIRGRVFVGCSVEMAGLHVVLASLHTSSWVRFFLTLKSSHAVSRLMSSPASLKPSLASSNKSWTLSLTRSVSRLVPRRFSCCDRRPILEVREKSFSERVSLKRLNSGSSRYSGSSLRRYVVG